MAMWLLETSYASINNNDLAAICVSDPFRNLHLKHGSIFYLQCTPWKTYQLTLAGLIQ